jgi:hypothetical protein
VKRHALRSNEEHVCQHCIRNGRRNVVARREQATLGVVWGYQVLLSPCISLYLAILSLLLPPPFVLIGHAASLTPY